jgi:hypothetical protein
MTGKAMMSQPHKKLMSQLFKVMSQIVNLNKEMAILIQKEDF